MATNRYTATADLTKTYRYVRSVTVTETSGSAAVRAQLRNGNDGTNDQVLISLGAVTSGSASFTPTRPMFFSKGVRLEFATGAGAVTIEGY